MGLRVPWQDKTAAELSKIIAAKKAAGPHATVYHPSYVYSVRVSPHTSLSADPRQLVLASGGGARSWHRG